MSEYVLGNRENSSLKIPLDTKKTAVFRLTCSGSVVGCCGEHEIAFVEFRV
jgi:hypothetical protein